jgi:glycosyltransferase involved in cell wall biosynthesis
MLGYGVELVIDQLARRLTAMGHSVRVYCCMNDGSYSEAPYEVVNVEVPSWRSPNGYEMNAFRSIRPMLDEEDLLVVEAFPFFFTGYSSEKPWVAVDHGVVPSSWFSGARREWFDCITASQYGKYIPRASAIVSISNFLRKQLPDGLQVKARVIYSGADHYATDFRVNLDGLLGKEGVRVLYVGRSTDSGPYKDTPRLLESWKAVKEQYPTTKLIMVTTCSVEEEEKLRAQGAVVFKNLAPEFMPSILNAASVYATATKWEGFDLPIVEAAYFGVPSVAYDIGAHSEVIVHEKTGLLAGNEEEFTNYLLKIVSDPSLRNRLGTEARIRAQREFRWDECAQTYERLFRELC